MIYINYLRRIDQILEANRGNGPINYGNQTRKPRTHKLSEPLLESNSAPTARPTRKTSWSSHFSTKESSKNGRVQFPELRDKNDSQRFPRQNSVPINFPRRNEAGDDKRVFYRTKLRWKFSIDAGLGAYTINASNADNACLFT